MERRWFRVSLVIITEYFITFAILRAGCQLAALSALSSLSASLKRHQNVSKVPLQTTGTEKGLAGKRG